jgi:hypothetical protein
MLNIKVFGKKDCDACKSTIKKFETFANTWKVSDKIAVNFIDMETVDGLTEGTLLNVGEIPTSIIEQNGKEVARWDGKVPLSEEFKPVFERLTK